VVCVENVNFVESAALDFPNFAYRCVGGIGLVVGFRWVRVWVMCRFVDDVHAYLDSTMQSVGDLLGVLNR
jgi:hypothetical protein